MGDFGALTLRCGEVVDEAQVALHKRCNPKHKRRRE